MYIVYISLYIIYIYIYTYTHIHLHTYSKPPAPVQTPPVFQIQFNGADGQEVRDAQEPRVQRGQEQQGHDEQQTSGARRAAVHP